MNTIPWLSLVIWWPILAGFFLLLICGSSARPDLARQLALAKSLIGLLLCIPIFATFNPTLGTMQLEELASIVSPRFDAQGNSYDQTLSIYIFYRLGIDGLSLWLVALNSLITVLVVLFTGKHLTKNVPQYLACFLIMSGLLNGSFLALDGILFYVFFEASLIPMYLIIGIWGGERRVYAAFKFFLYTMMGSLLLLVAFVYLFTQMGHFMIVDLPLEKAMRYQVGSVMPGWVNLPLSLTEQKWLFAAIVLAFAVKVPMWPVHTWLPDAHVEAPTGGSAVLAAIMLKLGTYGMIRWVLPIVPDGAMAFAPIMIGLSLIAIVYIGLVAMVQSDMKKLVAYSSIAHMGFVTLGIFIYQIEGWSGAMIQMISHGFISAGMFFCIGVLYDRLHTRQISDYGGVVHKMPTYATLFVFFAMANAGLPATSGFVGEFWVMIGTIKFNLVTAFFAGLSLILAAGYSLWLTKRVIFGAIANDQVASLWDLEWREKAVLILLALLVLYMGIFPQHVYQSIHPSLEVWFSHATQSKITP